MLDHALIQRYIAAQPCSLLFVTMSGAHLYGFESADSDYDLRGCHVLPARELLGLDEPDETLETMDKSGPIEMDLVTHDAKKFFRLLLKNNGYVLEQIFSPIVLHAAPEFEELRSIARRCITRHHNHHFRNFAQNQWDAVSEGKRRTVKGLLYSYRPLLAGIHLMRTGQVESNIVKLNEVFRLPHIDDLVAQKRGGTEKGELKDSDMAFHEKEFARLREELESARAASNLPDEASGRRDLDSLLIRLRFASVRQG